MKEQNTHVTYTRSELDVLPDETDWERVDALTDEDIEKAALSDPDDPPTDADFWKDATVVMPENMEEYTQHQIREALVNNQISKEKSMNQDQRQMTHNKAVDHVCYKLSELGWNVMPTALDAGGVFIRCVNEEESQTIFVKVRGRGTRDIAVSIPPSRDKIMGDFWIIVTELDYGAPTCYILLPDEIEEARETNINKKGEISHWFDRKYDIERFKENWERIGSGFIGSHTGG